MRMWQTVRGPHANVRVSLDGPVASDGKITLREIADEFGLLSGTISNATNTGPIAIQSALPHGLKAGDKVKVSGVLGNTAANGIWIVTPSATDLTRFTLNGSQGNGAWDSESNAEWEQVSELVINTQAAGSLNVNLPITAQAPWLPTQAVANVSGQTITTASAHGLIGTDFVRIRGVPIQTNPTFDANGDWSITPSATNPNQFTLVTKLKSLTDNAASAQSWQKLASGNFVVSWPDISTPGSLQVTHSSGLNQLFDFSNLSGADIANALDSVVSYLSSFEQFKFLQEKLPILNKSLAELVGIGSRFTNLIESYKKQPVETLLQMQTVLQTALGVPVTFTADGSALKIGFDFAPGNETQSLTLSGTPTGGTFRLTFQGQTTSPIPFNASASTIQAALIALSSIDSEDVVAYGDSLATGITVYFRKNFEFKDVGQLTADSSGLTGGTSPTLAVGTLKNGGASFDQELNINLDLGSLGIANLDGLVDVRGEGKVRVAADASVHIDLGIDLSNPESPRPFLYSGSTIAKLGAKVWGQDLLFSASVLSFGVAIGNSTTKGYVAIDSDGVPEGSYDPVTNTYPGYDPNDKVTYSIALTDNRDGTNDGRVYLTNLGAADLHENPLSGRFHINLPMFKKSDNSSIGALDWDFAVANPSHPFSWDNVPSINSAPDFTALLSGLNLSSELDGFGGGIEDFLSVLDVAIENQALDCQTAIDRRCAQRCGSLCGRRSRKNLRQLASPRSQVDSDRSAKDLRGPRAGWTELAPRSKQSQLENRTARPCRYQCQRCGDCCEFER